MNIEEAQFVQELLKENLELRKAAVVDELTQVYNYRHLVHQLPRYYARAKRQQAPLSIMMIDIDHFSKVNNNYGHEMGNVVLQEFSRIIDKAIRCNDVLYRYGGEEFAIILPGMTNEFAKVMAERIRVEIQEVKFGTQTQPIDLTCSIGIYTIPPEHKEDPVASLDKADQQLYKAKESGRNKVVN